MEVDREDTVAEVRKAGNYKKEDWRTIHRQEGDRERKHHQEEGRRTGTWEDVMRTGHRSKEVWGIEDNCKKVWRKRLQVAVGRSSGPCHKPY